MNKEEIESHILKTFWESWDENRNISLYLGVFSPEMYEQNEDVVDEIIKGLKSKEFYSDNYGG